MGLLYFEWIGISWALMNPRAQGAALGNYRQRLALKQLTTRNGGYSDGFGQVARLKPHLYGLWHSPGSCCFAESAASRHAVLRRVGGIWHDSVVLCTLQRILYRCSWQDSEAECVARTGLCDFVRQAVSVRAMHWLRMGEALSRQPMRDI